VVFFFLHGVIDKSHLDNKNKNKKFLDKRLGVSNQQN
jgi:hypothetical protein